MIAREGLFRDTLLFLLCLLSFLGSFPDISPRFDQVFEDGEEQDFYLRHLEPYVDHVVLKVV